MKKFNPIFIMSMIAFIGLSLTSCSENDELNTDQYGNGISLNSFGPSPILRGGTLHFLGSNLDQISEIDLPGADPITQIEVLKSGKESEITIQVPTEKCEKGIVKLVTAKGGIIETITPITYREDIVLSKFYINQDGNLTGNIGDVVTIKGDYLNLLHGVVFAGQDTVKEAQFVSHDRYTIQVAIPLKAKSGKLLLTDLATEPTEIETTEALIVNLPTVTALSNKNPKAGQTITVSGTSLNQIQSVKLGGATILEKDVTKASNGSSLSFVLPATAADGVISLVTYSGVDITTDSIKTVVPTELKVDPNPVKNGQTLTISGKDLDLVTGIAFPNATDAMLTSTSATKLTTTVPEKAIDGNIVLSMANGKSVSVPYVLVKPIVTMCNPTSLMAGEKVIISGTDLDLVSAISFPGETAQKVSEFTAQNATAIGLTVPSASAGTGFTLILKNGSEINIANGLTIQPATDPSIASVTPTGASTGKTITIIGKNFVKVQNVYIGTYQVTKYTSRTDTEIICTVPETAAAGSYKIYLEDFTGKRFECASFDVLPAEFDLSTFAKYENQSGLITWPFNFSWGDSTGKIRMMKSDLVKLGIKLGSQLIVYKTVGITGQVQINDANWGGVYTIADWDGTAPKIIQTFDAAMMKAVTTTSDGWSDTAFILQGDLSGVTKMTILP